jgi:hypothetical protein
LDEQIEKRGRVLPGPDAVLDQNAKQLGPILVPIRTIFRERGWISAHCAALARGLHYFLGIPADYREVFVARRQSQFKNPMLYHLS